MKSLLDFLITEQDLDPLENTKVATDAWIEALESYMDDLELDLAMEAALEAEGDKESGSATSASGIGAKIRGAFSKLKNAVSKGDKKAAAEAQEEVEEAAEELSDAADEAETPEQKKKLSTAAKIGLAAAATVAVTAGVTALGAALDKKAKASGNEPKAVAKVLINASRAVLKVPRAIKDDAKWSKETKAKLAEIYGPDDPKNADRYRAKKLIRKSDEIWNKSMTTRSEKKTRRLRDKSNALLDEGGNLYKKIRGELS